MPREEGLNVIEVNKDSLIKKLEENREKHKKDYEVSLAGWKEEVKEALEKALANIKDGEEPQTHFHLPKPQDHSEEYDEVIEFLKFANNATFTLTREEHRQYALDKWGWKRQWEMSNSTYMAKAASASSF